MHNILVSHPSGNTGANCSTSWTKTTRFSQPWTVCTTLRGSSFFPTHLLTLLHITQIFGSTLFDAYDDTVAFDQVKPLHIHTCFHYSSFSSKILSVPASQLPDNSKVIAVEQRKNALLVLLVNGGGCQLWCSACRVRFSVTHGNYKTQTSTTNVNICNSNSNVCTTTMNDELISEPNSTYLPVFSSS